MNETIHELITLKNVITNFKFLAISVTETTIGIFIFEQNKFRHAYTIDAILQIKSMVLKNNILVVMFEQNFIGSYILDETSFF